MEITIRIDGNSDYTYAKATLVYFKYDRVIEAIKECVCTGEAVNVKGIQGLTVSDW